MKSKFKIVTLILVVLSFGFSILVLGNMLYLFFTDFEGMMEQISKESNFVKFGSPFGFLIFLVSPFVLIKYFKTVRINKSDIELNYLLPIFDKQFKWTDFDYFILVDEAEQYGSTESLWFIKDKKVRVFLTGKNYSNYYELKNEISKFVRNKGKIRLLFHQQVMAYFGKPIKNLD